MFNRTNLLIYISKFLVIVLLNVCRVKCETQCPLNFCTTFSIVVIKLLLWSLNYWRGYWTVVWSLNYWHGYWSVGWSLNWLYFLSCAHKTQKNERKKEKGFQCPKDDPPLKGECCKSFSWFIRYQTINEENTEHPLPLYWSTYMG